VAIDVNVHEALVARLMVLRPDDSVMLLLRFNEGGILDESGLLAFETAGNLNAVDWYTNRVERVPHAFCSLTIQQGGLNAEPDDAA
jgi:hypothetical protein